MLFVMTIAKGRKPQNKVRFFITRHRVPGFGQSEWILWLGKPYLTGSGIYVSVFSKSAIEIATNIFIDKFRLNSNDYEHMKDGEIKEVFLNLED